MARKLKKRQIKKNNKKKILNGNSKTSLQKSTSHQRKIDAQSSRNTTLENRIQKENEDSPQQAPENPPTEIKYKEKDINSKPNLPSLSSKRIKLYSSAIHFPTLGRWAYLNLINLSIWLIVMGYVFTHPKNLQSTFQSLPEYIRDNVSIFLYTIVLFRFISVSAVALFSLKEPSRNDKFGLIVRKFIGYSEIIFISFMSLLIMHSIGVVDILDKFIRGNATFIKDKYSYVFSNILVWIVSGIAGNAAYDFLKKGLKKVFKSQK